MSEHQVLEALKVLYDNGSDASERAVVSNYLSCFQRSLLSWNVTLNLLSRQDSLPIVSQLFAAQTLKEKLRTQSYQLSQDSWQPVRSCIISVLQRPCEAALETQACLCLVTVIIILNITDEGCVSQLKPLISPTRLLRVLQLLAEEVAHDCSPYQLVPGVDKVAWWLQAQRGAVSMAPAVFAVVSECVSSAQAGKQTPDGTPMDAQTSSHDEEGQPEIAESENILKRGLDCAAAWFKLGVLLTIPGSAYEGVVQEALCSAASSSSAVSTAACEALAEAFERCPDPLLLHLQPQVLDLTVFALNTPLSISEEHQFQLVSLISTYVQSSADSLVAGGRSDLLQQLFVATAVRAQNAVGDMAAAHAVDALVATGRALQAAVKEEGSSGVLPAHLQGLLQVCCEGVVGLLPVLQATLVTCVEEPSQMHTSLLEQLQEVYAVIAPQIGAATFCQALAKAQSTPPTTSQSHACNTDQVPIAAMLTALSSAPGVLRRACKDPTTRVSGDSGSSSAASKNTSSIAQGILHLMEQCRVQAAHNNTPAAARIAALGALFAAVPAFAQLLICEADTAFNAAAPMIAASALQVLRACSACRTHVSSAAATADSQCRRALKFHNHLEQDATEATVSMEADSQPQMHEIHARMSSDLMNGEDPGEDSLGMHVLYGPASSAIASLIRALQGSEQELSIVDETVAVMNAVQLPCQCDEKLLIAAYIASVQVTRCISGGSDACWSQQEASASLSQDSGLVGVAWRIVESVSHDMQQSVKQMAGHLRVYGTKRPRTSLDAACMDTQPSGAPLNSFVGVASDGGAAGDQSELLELSEGLLKHLTRAAAMLSASRDRGNADEDSADSDADSAELTESPQPPAVSLHLISRLAAVVEPLSAVLSSPGLSATVVGPLRRMWGKAQTHAIALDACAAEVLLPCVFSVVAEAASVDVLVDWQDVFAVMMDSYLPRSAGFPRTADRILTALQTIWTLSELQALPCPGEADMIPEVSVASSMLCTHVARSALTPTSFLSMESVVPLVEVGMARCSMAASASLRHVASAALSALLSMLSAAASLPECSLSPVAACVLRGGGTMMMGFACALTAPGAVNRVMKLTQLLLQLTALVARAVPLLSQPPLVALPHPPGLSLSMSAFPPQPTQPRGNTPLSPAAVTQGVAYVLLWLKHALACLRPGMLQAYTPDSICAAWQPLLSQALLAGVPAPVALPTAAAPVGSAPGAVWQAVLGHAFPPDLEHSAGLAIPGSLPSTAPSIVSQQIGFSGSASPFVGLPAAATTMSLPPGAAAWGSLGAGVRFGSSLRADIPFAAQLTANMITAAALTDLHSASPASEAFYLSEALASPACRALKKAVRVVVASVGAACNTSTVPHLGGFLSSTTAAAAAAVGGVGIGGISGVGSATPMQLPHAPQQIFAQQALCVPGGPIAQPVFPFVPHVIAGAMTPAQLHVPMGNPLAPQLPVMHSVSPATVAVAAAPTHATHVTPSLSAPLFAASAAPAMYYSAPTFPADRFVSPQAAHAVPALRSSPDAHAMVQCSLAASVGAGHVGSMAPLAQQLQAVAIASPGGNKAKPFLGMDTDENAR